MSDRLALSDAIEDAGIERTKAARIATVIFEAIHQNVATKADVQASEASVRGEMRERFGRQDVAIERLRSSIREMESRITVRLGGIVVAAVAALGAVQHFWH
jgi:hypothetical protein